VKTQHSLAKYTLFTVPSRIQVIHHCLLVTIPVQPIDVSPSGLHRNLA
jgi:hypothetical protein